jgi:hypothetical protein
MENTPVPLPLRGVYGVPLQFADGMLPSSSTICSWQS